MREGVKTATVNGARATSEAQTSAPTHGKMSTVSAEELDALEAALLEELERKKAATAAPVATPATRTRLPEPTRSYAKQSARTAATAPRKFAPKAATPQATW